MSVEDEIKRLGGVHLIFGAPIIPDAKDLALATKAYGRPLPKDYLDYILKHGESGFNQCLVVDFPSEMPIYVDDDPDTLTFGPLDGADFGVFYGGPHPKGNYL